MRRQRCNSRAANDGCTKNLYRTDVAMYEKRRRSQSVHCPVLLFGGIVCLKRMRKQDNAE